MGNPARFLSYLVITTLSVITLIYYLSNTDIWDLYGYNLGFVVLVASTIYTGYMFVHELVKPEGGRIVAAEGGIGAEQVRDRNFMVDVYFKYLFCFSYAVLLFYIIFVLRTNFEAWEKFPTNWYYASDIYVNLILPVFIISEHLITNRYRHHHLLADTLVILILTFIHCAYKVLIRSLYYQQYRVVFPTIADYVMIFLRALNGYTLYDFMLYRKLNPQGEYALFA